MSLSRASSASLPIRLLKRRPDGAGRNRVDANAMLSYKRVTEALSEVGNGCFGESVVEYIPRWFIGLHAGLLMMDAPPPPGAVPRPCLTPIRLTGSTARFDSGSLIKDY